jgi:hypothetical protein
MRKKTEKVIKKIEWPGAFELINQARKLLRVNIWNMLTIFVGYLFAYLIIGQVASNYAFVNRTIKLPKHQSTTVTDVKSYPVLILCLLVMMLAYSLFYLLITYYSFKNTESKTIELSEAFKDSKKYYIRFSSLTLISISALFVNIMTVSFIVSSLSAITSPGVAMMVALIIFFAELYFILPRIVLVYCLVLRENLSILSAIKKSWKITKNYLGKIQKYIIASATWLFLAFFLAILIIGLPLAIYIAMFMMSSPALLYNLIKTDE